MNEISDGIPLDISDGIPLTLGCESEDYPMWSQLRVALADTIPMAMPVIAVARTKSIRKATV